MQSFALALLFCFSFNLDSLLIPQILETTFFFLKTYLIFFLYFQNLLPLLWIIAAFFQLAVFPHIFSPQTKRQKLVKQTFRESHHVRFFLLKKICLDFFFIAHPLKSCFQLLPKFASFIQSPSNHILPVVTTLVLHLTLASVMPILALSLSFKILFIFGCVWFVLLCAGFL